MKARGWTQSELARRAGVSRQAVSLWFQKAHSARVYAPHLLRMAEALGVAAEELARPLPLHNELRAALLWDRLYPDLDDFAIAVNLGEPQAIGRLVEVYGLFRAEKIAGERVWEDFTTYERFIHPVRRRQLSVLIQWRKNRTAT